MKTTTKHLEENLKSYAAKKLEGAEPGHDYCHSLRVLHNARQLMEGIEVNEAVIIAASLLHDIADSKFADEESALLEIDKTLTDNNIEKEDRSHIKSIITKMSFSKERAGTEPWKSIEFDIVQDADRLDALGAIGIARAFSYGGYRSRPLYGENRASTIAHFHEKLLLLHDMMKTGKGREMAIERRNFMLQFLEQFNNDCNI